MCSATLVGAGAAKEGRTISRHTRTRSTCNGQEILTQHMPMDVQSRAKAGSCRGTSGPTGAAVRHPGDDRTGRQADSAANARARPTRHRDALRRRGQRRHRRGRGRCAGEQQAVPGDDHAGAHSHFAYGGIARSIQERAQGGRGLGAQDRGPGLRHAEEGLAPGRRPRPSSSGTARSATTSPPSASGRCTRISKRASPVCASTRRPRAAAPHRLRAQAQRGAPGHADPDGCQRPAVLVQGREGVRHLRSRTRASTRSSATPR
jgi:hypothetical protein